MIDGRKEKIHIVESGETIDGFVVGELYNEGGMAHLYHVTHPDWDIPLLMKVPKIKSGGPLSSFVAFEVEQRVMARLKGRHFPKLAATGDMARCPYIVMEYIEGDDLHELVQQAPVKVDAIRDVMVPVCHALHVLHQYNVIHLDIKPDNVRFRPNGTAVLLDFGCAHHTRIPDLLDTAFADGEGTVPYIAPEQVARVRSETRSDIFALGVILYELATGELPYGRTNLISLKRRQVHEPPPPRYYNPKIPMWLQEIILRCLEIYPQDRYVSAKRIAHLLLHPEDVVLTKRARRKERTAFFHRLMLWARSLYRVFDEGELVHPTEHLHHVPHVLIAIDLTHKAQQLQFALRDTIKKFSKSFSKSYFTCMTVFDEKAMEKLASSADNNNQATTVAELQVALRNWGQALTIPRSKLDYQVLPGDPATTILDYAHDHMVDYIIIASRGSSVMRRFMGSVSTKVVAEAQCSVMVVRAQREDHENE